MSTGELCISPDLWKPGSNLSKASCFTWI
jgi:hypothetical protein